VAKALLETQQSGLLPSLEAIEARTLRRIVGILGVVPWHDVQSNFRGTVQECPMVVLRVQAQRVVQSHGIATECCNRCQVVATLRTPLLGIASLEHVLRRQPLTSTSMRCARQWAICDSTHGGLQWELGLRCRACRRFSSGGVRKLRATAEALPTWNQATPSCGNSSGTLRLCARQPLKLCAEAMDRPTAATRTRCHLVAKHASLTERRTAQAEEPEVHLPATLPIGRLELEEGRSQEVRVPAGNQVHGLEIRLDDCLLLAVASILADEPRDGREVLVLLGDHLLHEVPR